VYAPLMAAYGTGVGIDFGFDGTVANTLHAHRLIPALPGGRGARGGRGGSSSTVSDLGQPACMHACAYTTHVRTHVDPYTRAHTHTRARARSRAHAAVVDGSGSGGGHDTKRETEETGRRRKKKKRDADGFDARNSVIQAVRCEEGETPFLARHPSRRGHRGWAVEGRGRYMHSLPTKARAWRA
jgi:hypothetical protein